MLAYTELFGNQAVFWDWIGGTNLHFVSMRHGYENWGAFNCGLTAIWDEEDQLSHAGERSSFLRRWSDLADDP